ncbi:unnamed protein product [Cutaneotrichosporon oleaginosum]
MSASVATVATIATFPPSLFVPPSLPPFVTLNNVFSSTFPLTSSPQEEGQACPSLPPRKKKAKRGLASGPTRSGHNNVPNSDILYDDYDILKEEDDILKGGRHPQGGRRHPRGGFLLVEEAQQVCHVCRPYEGSLHNVIKEVLKGEASSSTTFETSLDQHGRDSELGSNGHWWTPSPSVTSPPSLTAGHLCTPPRDVSGAQRALLHVSSGGQ